MAGAGWSHFWRRGKGGPALLGTVARAAVGPVSDEGLLEHAARVLLQVGRAEWAAVWLDQPQSPDFHLGAVVRTGSGPVPETWKRLNVSLPFFRAVLGSEQPVVEDLSQVSDMQVRAPMPGMGATVWLPLRTQSRTLGLALAAYTRSPRALNLEGLQSVADELALAVAQRRDQKRLERWQGEAAARNRLQEALAQGAAPSEILPRVLNEAARETGAEFVALGRASQHGLDFDFIEGQPEWLPLLQEKPLWSISHAALEEQHAVELSGEALRHSLPQVNRLHGERLARVVAVPLAADGERLGVLLAGLPWEAEPAAGVERLGCCAALAAWALWKESQRAVVAGVEARCRSLLDSSGEWLLVVDQEGFVVDRSRSAVENANLPINGGHPVRIEDLFAGEARTAVARWRALTRSEQPEAQRAPLEVALPGGVTLALHLLPGPAGAPLADGRRLVRVENLTAQRAAGNKQKQLEAELQGLLDSVDSGIVLVDASGRLRLFNERFVQLMGLEAHRMAELKTFDALVEAVGGNFRGPHPFTERQRGLASGEESCWEELELLRPTRRVVERFARPVRDAEGERVGWLEAYRDVTSQRLIVAKMFQTEKMAALGQLVSGIAHELNNPLTSIMGYAQLLLGRRPGPERTEAARRIHEEAERAGRIVKNMLLFARETKPERRAVNLNEVVERTVALRSYELKVENIAVELALEADLPATLGDATQLQQVVLNLIVNAEQAIQQGRGHGHIRIRTQGLAEQRVLLEVADDGPGVPPEIASRIFDPFFTTKPAGLGTGLGLSIVYGVVQEYGGEVSVDSQPGRGATFLVELPVAEVSAAASRAAATAGEPRQPVEARPERILVVEDEPTVARLIADVLGESGYPVDTVLDSRKGLEQLRRQEYALLICDLKMPYLDGRAFYRALVRAGSPLQHRIIFVTGDTLAPHTLEFLEATGLPYLAKPFLVEELTLAVQRALGAAAEPPQAPGGESAMAPPGTAGWARAAGRKR